MRYPEPYLTLYNASAAAIKAVSPRLRVGGPATAALAHVADFLADTKRLSLPVDFVSTHSCETTSYPLVVRLMPPQTTVRLSHGCVCVGPDPGEGVNGACANGGDMYTDPECFSKQVNVTIAGGCDCDMRRLL